VGAVAFGVIAFPLGLFLWSGLGTHFGLGKAREALIAGQRLLLSPVPQG